MKALLRILNEIILDIEEENDADLELIKELPLEKTWYPIYDKTKGELYGHIVFWYETNEQGMTWQEWAESEYDTDNKYRAIGERIWLTSSLTLKSNGSVDTGRLIQTYSAASESCGTKIDAHNACNKRDLANDTINPNLEFYLSDTWVD